jgi:hypothetical protein
VELLDFEQAAPDPAAQFRLREVLKDELVLKIRPRSRLARLETVLGAETCLERGVELTHAVPLLGKFSIDGLVGAADQRCKRTAAVVSRWMPGLFPERW